MRFHLKWDVDLLIYGVFLVLGRGPSKVQEAHVVSEADGALGR